MSDETSDIQLRSAVKYKIDTTKINYHGELTAFSVSDKIFLFFNETPSLYSNLHLISHEGKTDFSVYFGSIGMGGQIFKVNLVIVLSFNEVLNFLDFLKTMSTSGSEQVLNTKDDEIKRTEYLVQPMVDFNTIYFSPNTYFTLDTPETKQIYFGRKIGKIENKDGSLMYYQVALSTQSILSLIKALEINIAAFEKDNAIKLRDIVVKEKAD